MKLEEIATSTTRLNDTCLAVECNNDYFLFYKKLECLKYRTRQEGNKLVFTDDNRLGTSISCAYIPKGYYDENGALPPIDIENGRYWFGFDKNQDNLIGEYLSPHAVAFREDLTREIASILAPLKVSYSKKRDWEVMKNFDFFGKTRELLFPDKKIFVNNPSVITEENEGTMPAVYFNSLTGPIKNFQNRGCFSMEILLPDFSIKVSSLYEHIVSPEEIPPYHASGLDTFRETYGNYFDYFYKFFPKEIEEEVDRKVKKHEMEKYPTASFFLDTDNGAMESLSRKMKQRFSRERLHEIYTSFTPEMHLEFLWKEGFLTKNDPPVTKQ